MAKTQSGTSSWPALIDEIFKQESRARGPSEMRSVGVTPPGRQAPPRVRRALRRAVWRFRRDKPTTTASYFTPLYRAHRPLLTMYSTPSNGLATGRISKWPHLCIFQASGRPHLPWPVMDGGDDAPVAQRTSGDARIAPSTYDVGTTLCVP